MKYNLDKFAATLYVPRYAPNADAYCDSATYEAEDPGLAFYSQARIIHERANRYGYSVVEKASSELYRHAALEELTLAVWDTDNEPVETIRGFENIMNTISKPPDTRQDFYGELEAERTIREHWSPLPSDSTIARELYLRENQYGENHAAIAEYILEGYRGSVMLSYRGYNCEIEAPVEEYEGSRLIQNMKLKMERYERPYLRNSKINEQTFSEDKIQLVSFTHHTKELVVRQDHETPNDFAQELRFSQAQVMGMMATFWTIDSALNKV